MKEERKKQGEKSERKKSECRKESEEREGRRKKEKGERKQQRKMVAPETARPHQNLHSDADERDEMRNHPT